MSDVEPLDARPVAERFVLLSVADLHARAETPAHSFEVKRACERHLDALGGDIVGRVSEADIMRAMNALAGEGLLTRTEIQEQSAVGKGRPTYTLGVDTGELLDSMADDERLGSLFDSVRAAERA
jgi:hypothetical protein